MDDAGTHGRALLIVIRAPSKSAGYRVDDELRHVERSVGGGFDAMASPCDPSRGPVDAWSGPSGKVAAKGGVHTRLSVLCGLCEAGSFYLA